MSEASGVLLENASAEPARVEWINRDFDPHTATADNNKWDTGLLKNKATGRLVTTKPGEFSYHCTFHPHMKGVIIVA
jgi:plastocyanin